VVLLEVLAVTELLDANPFEELPSDSSAQASMSPNAEVLDANLEPLLVFAMPSEHAEYKFLFLSHPASSFSVLKKKIFLCLFVFLFTHYLIVP